MICMPNFFAFSSFEPGFSPTKTMFVAPVTDDEQAPPWASIISSALLLEKFASVPVRTTFFPANYPPEKAVSS